MLWDILSFPFKLAGWALSFTGHVLGFILGLVLFGIGLALCFTLIGLIVGIPLVALGVGLMMKCFF